MDLERTFNFHGVVGLRVTSGDHKAAAYFEAEYGTAAGPIPESMPRVELRWTHSRLPRRPSTKHRLRIHKGLARWYYRLDLRDDRALIDAIGNRTALPMVHHMMVHGSLRYLCSFRNAVLLHASGVAHIGRSLIFTGTGGVGKTTLSSLTLAECGEDWEMHADDYVFLTSSGGTLEYPSRAHLYSDVLNWVPSVREQLNGRERAHLTLFGIIRRLSAERIKWPLRRRPADLWPNHPTADRAQLGALLFLSREDIDELRLERITDADALIAQLIKLNFHEARYTIDLVESFDRPRGWVANWERRERSTLAGALSGADLYRLVLPSSMQPTGSARVRTASTLVGVATGTDGIRATN